MKKIEFLVEDYKFTFTVENEIYNNKKNFEAVQILINYNIKNFLSKIYQIKNNQINYSILYRKENSYEPFGITINKFLKNK